MDQIYRYIWSSKKKPPLIEMQELGKNMWDVRKELGVKSVRGKVEERVLERIGHVMRMDDSRTTKACILGWMKELENYEKPAGRRRKTLLYWKKIVREAGMDTTDIARLTADRKKWKSAVKGRVRHLNEWEESKGNRWQGGIVVRNELVVPAVVFDCRVCGKICKSKGGLVNHRRRMHEESERKKKFKCEACEKVFKKSSELRNHSRVCGGAVANVGENMKCVCGYECAKENFKRHRKICETWKGVHPPETAVPVRAAPRAPCDVCGRVMRRDNIARHKREACPGGEAGP